jgi:hypothetical protein
MPQMDAENVDNIALGEITRRIMMDQPQNAPTGTRRNEDIALDLFKFIAGVTGTGRTAASSTGFTASSAHKPEDQVDHLLELYTRCVKTVSGDGR